MKNIFIENKYTRWYQNITRNAPLISGVDLHRHHVIPESFFIKRTRKGPPGWLEGNPDSPDNLVYLTYREHVVCHKLLVKMTTGKAKSKMIFALHFMISVPNSDNKLSSRQVERLRIEYTEALKEMWTLEKREQRSAQYSGEGGPFYGKNHTDEWKKNHSEKMSGITWEEAYGSERASEMKKKLSRTGDQNSFYGKTHTDDLKNHLAELRKGKTYEEIMGIEKAKETKQKQSLSRIGKTPVNKGKTLEEMHGKEKAADIKKKMSFPGELNGFYGKTHSSEQRAKKSKEKLDAPKKVCYHCGKAVDHMNYSRWHGDNCKHKGTL